MESSSEMLISTPIVNLWSKKGRGLNAMPSVDELYSVNSSLKRETIPKDAKLTGRYSNPRSMR